jgi:hypothetical protein
MGNFPSRPAILAVLLTSAVLSACASAPVQEMSDARQAIRAAQNAGASQKAAPQLESAQTLMSSAEKSLQKRLYRAAKRDAVAAREQAVEAMQRAAGQDAPKSGSLR